MRPTQDAHLIPSMLMSMTRVPARSVLVEFARFGMAAS